MHSVTLTRALTLTHPCRHGPKLHCRPAFESLAKDFALDDASAELLRSFNLKENDYCMGEKKVGGNAQSIIRERWVHVRSDAELKYLKIF